MNGIDITVAPHDQAVALLTGIRGEISLVVSRDQNDDVTPPQQPTNHSATPTVTWPTTPLEATPTELPIIVQPPTPNYAVVKDAIDVATDSFAVADVDIDVGEPRETVDATSADLDDPLIDLSDPGAPQCGAAATVTSRDDVITVACGEMEVELRTRELMSFDQFEQIEFDVELEDLDDDDDDLGLRPPPPPPAVPWPLPISSDVRDMIQHRMLDTLRLL